MRLRIANRRLFKDSFLEETRKHPEAVILPDANLILYAAAVAMEYRGTVHTADTDFRRFVGVKWFNPITGAVIGGLAMNNLGLVRTTLLPRISAEFVKLS